MLNAGIHVIPYMEDRLSWVALMWTRAEFTICYLAFQIHFVDRFLSVTSWQNDEPPKRYIYIRMSNDFKTEADAFDRNVKHQKTSKNSLFVDLFQ